MARSRPSACAPRCCSKTAIRWLWKTPATARRAWPSPRPARYRTGSTSTPRACAATGSRALPAAAWPMSRRRTSTPPASPCRWRGAWSCWSGPSAPTAGSSRTTTTASIATAVRRWRRWPRWTDRAGCSTSGPSARSPSRRCAWATWWSRRRWSSASASGGPSRYAIRRWAPSGSWPTLSPRGISSATSAACAAPPAPAATPCCGAGQRRRVASRCRRWRRGCTCACGSTAWRGSGP